MKYFLLILNFAFLWIESFAQSEKALPWVSAGRNGRAWIAHSNHHPWVADSEPWIARDRRSAWAVADNRRNPNQAWIAKSQSGPRESPWI